MWTFINNKNIKNIKIATFLLSLIKISHQKKPFVAAIPKALTEIIFF